MNDVLGSILSINRKEIPQLYYQLIEPKTSETELSFCFSFYEYTWKQCLKLLRMFLFSCFLEFSYELVFIS